MKPIKTTRKLSDFIDKSTYGENSEILEAMQERMVYNVEVDRDEEEIRFTFSDAVVVFYHNQDCCESVVIDDINGDINDLIGTMLIIAEERISETPEGDDDPGESNTWTFYTFRSVKGSVDVKWHGESNGYYSESVDIAVRNRNH